MVYSEDVRKFNAIVSAVSIHPRFYILFLLLFSFVSNSYQISCSDLKIMSLNVWGMPPIFGSQYKEERISAIANEISKGDFDIYLLQELWLESDHKKIAASLPIGYYITGFRQMSEHILGFMSVCDGIFSPAGCSGLAIISRYTFKEVEFKPFAYHGDIENIFIDGEVLAKKGAGRVRIQPFSNITIDMFVTHTAADPDPCYGYTLSLIHI